MGGCQLIPEQWVAEATSKQVGNPGGENPDWQQGYGFQFWMARHGYPATGIRAVLRDPARARLGRWSPPPARSRCRRCSTPCGRTCYLASAPPRRIPGPRTTSYRPARPPGAAGCAAAPAPVDRAAWAGAPFTVTARPGNGQISRRSPQSAWRRGRGGAQITLIEPANSLTVGVGAGEWTVSAPADGHGDTIPVAASGGWLDDRAFPAEVIFLETRTGWTSPAPWPDAAPRLSGATHR